MSRALVLPILTAAVALAGALAGPAAPAAAATPAAAAQSGGDLLILSTASNRGEVDHCGCHNSEKGGLTRRTAYIDSMRSRGPVLVVDAGDYSHPAATAAAQEDWFILRAMDRMRYDAMTLGELELARGADYVRAILDSTRVPVTLANVTFAGSGKPVGEKFILKKVGGVTCGVIGLVGPDLGDGAAKLADLGFAIEDPIAAAKRLVPEVKAKADVVVVLAHIPAADAAKLPESVPGIGAVILGHYPGTEAPTAIGGAVVIRSGQRGQYVGETRIAMGAGAKVASFEGEAVAMDKKVIREDPRMLADLRALMRSVGKELRDDAKMAAATTAPAGLAGPAAPPEAGRPAERAN